VTTVCLQFNASLVGRDSRSLDVISDRTRELIKFEDRTGDLEALLELLREGSRTRRELIGELVAKREGVSPAALGATLDALNELGLVRDAGPASPVLRSVAEREPEERRAKLAVC
jgi:DNA-binding transcriptional ArsR family regulator